MTPKVSIVTPSIRKDGLELIRESLLNQTFTDWEWIVCSPFPVEDAIWVPDHFPEGEWSLNRAYNAMFKKAEGDIIISWQDWIWLPPDAIEKMVNAIETSGGIVSGVGDQYARLNGDTGKPEVKIWSDPRKTDKYGSFYEVNYNDCEWNFCGFKNDDIYEVGGMDEHLDLMCRGVDQIQVCERWNDMGKHFFLDQTNESFTLRHGREDYGGEDAWNASHGLFNGMADKRKQELKSKGRWPVLTYL